MSVSYNIPIYYNDREVNYYLYLRGGLGIIGMQTYFLGVTKIPLSECISLY